MEKVVIVAKEEKLTKRKVREKIEIKMNHEFMNRDEGKILNETWNPLLHKLTIKKNMTLIDIIYGS